MAPCFFAIFIDILGFGLVYPVLTALFISDQTTILPPGTSQEIRYFYLSLGFLLYPLFMFFGASFMGDISDLFGRKKVLLVCMTGLFVGFSLMGIGVERANIPLLLVGRAFCGLMGASMPIALAAIADLSQPHNKAVHMSFVALIQSFGFVLGPFMGGLLSDKSVSRFFNFSTPFFASSLLALIALVWIWTTFEETFVKKLNKQIDLKRIFLVFVEASKHKKIRLLSLVFLFMQIGLSLYLQLILIFYKKTFDYSSLMMGFFNAFLGIWFAVGLVLIVPYMAKRYRVEWIAIVSLLVTGASELLIAIIPSEILLWVLAIPFGVAVNVGFTSMLTSFSNAADANSQGWAMGITGSIVAISFVFTGLSPTLVPILGVKTLIFLGALFMLAAWLLMLIYYKKHIKSIFHP